MNFWRRCLDYTLVQSLEPEQRKYLVILPDRATTLFIRFEHCMSCHECLRTYYEREFDLFLDIPSKGFII